MELCVDDGPLEAARRSIAGAGYCSWKMADRPDHLRVVNGTPPVLTHPVLATDILAPPRSTGRCRPPYCARWHLNARMAANPVIGNAHFVSGSAQFCTCLWLPVENDATMVGKVGL